MGRWIIQAGLAIIGVGVVVLLCERAGIRLGRLPGDIRIAGKTGSFYFPVVTCILLSVVLSLLSWFFNRR